ncbi:MAG: OmpA family protein [Pseudomonadota bacterium]
MTPALRSATALATSLSLIVPSLPMIADAQQATPTREDALAACQLSLGATDGAAVEACLTDALVAAGIDPNATESAADAAPEAEVVEGTASEEEAPQAEAAEVEAAPLEAEAVTEQQAEPEVVIAEPVDDPAPAVTEETPTEETVVEMPAEDTAPEVAEEVPTPAEAQIEGAADESAAETVDPPVEAAEQTPAEPTPAEQVEAPVESDADTPGPARAQVQDEVDAAPAPMTRREARQLCRSQIDGGQRDAVQACMVETLEESGQADLAQRLADRFAAEADGEVNAATDSAVAEEIASQPEPDLTEAEALARDQTEAALATLEQAGTATPAAAATVEGDETEAEVVEEVVAAEDVRSSSEDFETAAVETDRDDDNGLSNKQKFALGALGALAVGTVLNNRTRVISNSGDRVVVQRDDGDLQVLKDDDALLRQAGSNIRTQSFSDGSTRSIVTREDGSQIITVRDASLRVLRRILLRPNGSEVVLIDDTAVAEPVDISELPPATLSARQGAAVSDPLRDALRREAGLDRRFSLAQVRSIAEVRALAPAFEVESVTFASASAAITPEQAGNLTDIAREVLSAIRENPREMFLIEGHTDAVGDAAYNLALSDRRAESLALALSEYFDVPVENMVVQGYGERFLKIPTLQDERQNRRATVRRITDLLQTAAAN